MNQAVDSRFRTKLLADEPLQRTCALALGLSAMYAAAHYVLPTGARNVWLLALCLPALALFAPMIALAPAHWAPKIQGVAFVAIGILVASLRHGGNFFSREIVQFFSLLLVLAAATVALPLEKLGVRRVVIALGIAAFIALSCLAPRLSYLIRWLILGWVWFVACVVETGSIVPGGPRRSVGQIVRTLSGMCAIWPFAMVAPPRCFAALERSPSTILRGGFWVSAGLLMHGGLRELGRIPWLDAPLEGQLGQDGFLVLWGTSLAFWAVTFMQLISRYIMVLGTLGMLGVLAPFPIGKIWEMTDFLRYWRKANVWYYTFCMDVFARHFIPKRGPGLYIGILAIFGIFSSIMHGGHRTIYTLVNGLEVRGDIQWIRWTLEGVLAAATLWWIQRSARARMARYVKEGGGRRSRPSRISGLLKVVVSLVIVLGLHGVFMRMTKQSYVPGRWRKPPAAGQWHFVHEIKNKVLHRGAEPVDGRGRARPQNRRNQEKTSNARQQQGN